MEFLIINNSRIITFSSSGASDSQIIQEAQKRFPKDFPSSVKKWKLERNDETTPHLATLSPHLPDENPGGYNCDRCDDAIYDDIRFHNLELEEDYCPDCCDETEKAKKFIKLSARPKIAQDLKREFVVKEKRPLLTQITSEEKAIERLRVLLSYLGRDGNAKNLILVEDSTKCFAIKKIKPMLCDEDKTLKITKELMQEYFSKCNSEKFCAFRKKVLNCESLEDLENLKGEQKKRKINGAD
jgi:hypothetical protein